MKWLKSGTFRYQLQDPELQQALANYRRLVYSEKWIARRLKSIDIRKDLTDEWKARGLRDEREYAMLTNVIYREWAGMTAGEYKRFKGTQEAERAEAGALDVEDGPAPCQRGNLEIMWQSLG